MMGKLKKGGGWFLIGAILVLLAWTLIGRIREATGPQGGSRDSNPPAPVEVEPIERGTIERRKSFTGALESAARFVVAPKVSGRIERLIVDIGDEVTRGALVAELDNEEFVQEVRQAEAERAVAEANQIRAENDLKVAERELKRVQSLWEREIASEAELDRAHAEKLAKESALAIAEAEIKRSESAIETAKIRLGYTRITADWSQGDDPRIVAERYVDEGDTVSANAPLLSIVTLNPIKAVISVTERDYGMLKPGQGVAIQTDAFPQESFSGKITRLAPVFQEGSRQARVELSIQNPDHRLKPGMFVRATVMLERVEEATIIPTDALLSREGQEGIFLVAGEGQTVQWQPVTRGIQQGNHIQILEDKLTGRVVTLGQHMLDDGSPITIPEPTPHAPSEKLSAE